MSLSLKYTYKCDQLGCPETVEQDFPNLPAVGQIPMPQLPQPWQGVPGWGLVCPRHQVKVVPKEDADARPRVAPIPSNLS